MWDRKNLFNKICLNFKKKRKPKSYPIDAIFNLPSPLPSWPAGERFGDGTIDLGGLEVAQVSSFDKVWATREGGTDNLGATFFEPSSIPDGFCMLGGYSQPNSRPLSGFVLVGKDVTSDGSALRPPTDYVLGWSSENSKIKQDGVGYIWSPTPPNGYKAIGIIVTSTPDKPALNKICCVREDLTDVAESGEWVWGVSGGINVYSLRPRNRGILGMGVFGGTFLAQNNGTDLGLVCLKNVGGKLDAMPNVDQIKALIQNYSPTIYFHPDEEYFPASVEWFFQNGALLYKKGEETNPVAIDAAGSNLPQGGTNDGLYWIDLPMDNGTKDRVKRGDLSNAMTYIHVKPMFGGTFTDIAIWLFYPFNGPAKAKVEFLNISLGKIGEHVGDWEHVTLRISNFNGELRSMYFAQHSSGVWVDASELEFGGGNKPVAYASWHGHASYPKPGLVLQGNGSIGIRNDSGKSKFVLDAGARFSVVNADYLGSAFVEPPWLNYEREWGPKISYNVSDEIKKIEKILPGKLKSAFDKVVRSIPNEVLGEEGPTGPKGKDSWSGDERS